MASERPWGSEQLLLIVALALLLAGSLYAYLTSPTWLTVAVGPADSPDDKLMRAFSNLLKQQRTAIRLKVLKSADVRAAAEAMDAGKADLAIVRPDVRLPDTGLTLAILRDAAAIVIAPTSSGIQNFDSLSGKKLGVAVGHEADPALITLILHHLELDQSVTIVPITRSAGPAALKSGEVDAVAIVAPPTGTVASDFVRSVNAEVDGITVIPVESAEAIAQRTPVFVAQTIPEGAWGGRPGRPSTATKTIGVSYRLMARSDADRGTMALVVESLFQMRSRLIGTARSARFMRAPETETATSAMLPNHPGAIDYFEREQQSFFDKYGDWVYLSAFFGSGIVSALAWLRQRFRRQRREVIDDVLDRLMAILSDARQATELSRIDGLTAEIDELVSAAVAYARAGSSGRQTTSALMLAIEGARGAVEDRRRVLETSAERSRRDGPRLVTAL